MSVTLLDRKKPLTSTKDLAAVLLLVLIPLALAGCGGYNKNSTYTAPTPTTPAGPALTIAGLGKIAKVATTVDPKNGDLNPYAIVMVPATATITSGNFKAGDLLVSNFSNSAGTNGAGTTIEDISPTATTPAPVTFSSMVAGPVALALNANFSALWVANYGLAPDGTSGNVQVLTNVGQTFTYGNIMNKALWGSWGQAFNGQAAGAVPAPAFFDTNVLNGNIYRLQGFPPTASSGPNFAAATITQIGALGHMGTNNNDVVGPQGMVYVAANDTLFVVDAVNNKIVSYAGVSTATTVLQPTVVFSGTPLNQPAGLAMNPLNGDLLIVNQGDNNLVEISLPSSSLYQGTLVGTKTLDPTAVVKGVGAALFGLTATKDTDGNLMVYFTNDNTNTVQVLKK
ncbi:MAG: hypothetical protein NVSMB62_26470 [Acidobacteriaceae bacterium]